MQRLARSALALIAAQAVGQIALIAVLPVLARFFPPTEVGILQLATSAALLLQPMATLSRELLLPTLGRVDTADRLYRSTCVVLGLVSAVVLATGIVWRLVDDGQIGQVLIVSALLLFAYGWIAIDNAVLIRLDQRGKLAIRNLIGGLLGASLQVAAALLLGDIIAVGGALLAGRGISIFITRPRGQVREASGLDGSPVADDAVCAKQGVRRTVVMVASQTLGLGGAQIATLASGAVFGAAAAGYVGVSQRFVGSPTALIGQGVAQVFQLSISRVIREGRPLLCQVFLRQSTLLLSAAVLVSAILVAIGPFLVVTLLGPGWEDAALFTQILAVPFALQLVGSPVSSLLIMVGRESTLLRFQVSRIVAMIASFSVMAAIYGALWAAILGLAVAMTSSYIVALALGVCAAREHDTATRTNASELAG